MKLEQISAWKLEASFVAIVLGSTAVVSGNHLTDWLGATAVFFTFMHGQISFDFSEQQARQREAQVACYRWSERYFFIKELLWVTTFTLLKAWPLLVGTIIFLTYPKWRSVFRTWKNSSKTVATDDHDSH